MRARLTLSSLIALALLLSSCAKEKLEYVSPNQPTAPTPLDEWIGAEYTTPYNQQVVYRASSYADPFFSNNTLPQLDKVKPVMEAMRVVWISTLNRHLTPKFMKAYGPRQIRLYGRPHFTPQDVGTIVTNLGNLITPIFEVDGFEKQKEREVYRLMRQITYAFAKSLLQHHPADLEAFAQLNFYPYHDWTTDKSTVPGYPFEDKLNVWGLYGYYSRAASINPINDFCETFSMLVCNESKVFDTYLGKGHVGAKTPAQKTFAAKRAFVRNYCEKFYHFEIFATIARDLPREIKQYAH